MTADDTTAEGTTGTARGGALRWAVLAALLGVLVAGVVVSALVVFGNGAGPGLGNRVSSVFDPPDDPSQDREEVLAASRTFVQRFNTYGPEMLDDAKRMPDYRGVGDLMTAKFAKAFEENLVIPEKAVAETGIDRVAAVYGVGISAIDADSATVLVGAEVTSSYPSADEPGERIDFEPQRFRYEVSLVRIEGAWLVDDLDDVDDGLPSFATSGSPDTGSDGAPAPSGSPTGTPSTDPTPEPSSPATEGSDAP
ncbi:MAG TPA: hypothetical protein VNS46_04520 [Nocardioides sp.]|nr:hypothetical protein [Nocardioides sp.]